MTEYEQKIDVLFKRVLGELLIYLGDKGEGGMIPLPSDIDLLRQFFESGYKYGQQGVAPDWR